MTANINENAMGPGSDSELIERIRSGDRTAFMKFYDRFSPLLFSVAARVLSDRKEAEDVLQEVMLVIWKKSGEYDPELGSLSSWAVVLTRNRALDRLRARTRRLRLIEEVALMSDGPEQSASPSAGDVVHGRERAEALRNALTELPPDQRMAIELAFFAGLSQSDIATRLQQPLGTVKARIRRGMLRLRERLGADL
ncbi:MAG TPA: sigma-70 family RNA polymerase sigma factor [Steroidobacteraceae bacterium]|jgi:RNA polymerase sigma-70 factor (ECF subfamily)|nr:sigma-70 family RNA polymerase sigma factor [Steroidobacteraceae bacterium]